MIPRLQRLAKGIQSVQQNKLNITVPLWSSSSYLGPSHSGFFQSPSRNGRHAFSSLTKPPMHNLPVMDALVKQTKMSLGEKPFERTAFVYIHHPLQTSVNVIYSLMALGAKPEYIHILGKQYSECPQVVSHLKSYNVQYQDNSRQVGLGKFINTFSHDMGKLWGKVEKTLGVDSNSARINSNIENVIIMDHGGHALSYVPADIIEKFNVVGIEKTTAGLAHLNKGGTPLFPIINMATCATKIYLESPLIAEAIVTKLQSLIPIKDPNKTCAVIGYGNIGKAVSKKLLSMGHKVIVYDITFKDEAKLEAARSQAAKLEVPNQTCKLVVSSNLDSIISSANYIFGCTGEDISINLDPSILNQDKVLISCSSEDKEFLTLIKKIQQEKNGKVATKPLNTLTYKSPFGGTITVIRGGFPANFDDSGESVPALDIQLTRALTLGSALQAREFFNHLELFHEDGKVFCLNPELQMYIAEEWLKQQPRDRVADSLIQDFKDKEWVIRNSNGYNRPLALDILAKKNAENKITPEKPGPRTPIIAI
jgi:S-adenosylhomocysteine hydrolase